MKNTLYMILGTLLLIGCDQQSTQSILGVDMEEKNNTTFNQIEATEFAVDANPLNKKIGEDAEEIYRIRKFDRSIRQSKTFDFDTLENVYNGGVLQIGNKNGSNFHVNGATIIPPANIPWGDPVTITMSMELNAAGNELIFDFGPSGTQFTKPARIKLDYSFLGGDNPQLYYVDKEGNYIEQEPDQINRRKKFLYLYVDHFSRYSVAYGR